MPSAAAMIRVLSINPTTISVDCAGRRGILRVPSLKRIGRRQAIHATPSKQHASAATSAVATSAIANPKTSSIRLPPYPQASEHDASYQAP